MRKNPCDYCPYQSTDKCEECHNRCLSYGLRQEESEAEELYYQAAVEYTEYCERYEPTYNPDDGSM